MTHDNRWFWLTIFVTCSFLLYLLSPILTPFILGAMLAYLADPLVDK
jgi:predicted PurR-regulated permease PerM